MLKRKIESYLKTWKDSKYAKESVKLKLQQIYEQLLVWILNHIHGMFYLLY